MLVNKTRKYSTSANVRQRLLMSAVIIPLLAFSVVFLARDTSVRTNCGAIAMMFIRLSVNLAMMSKQCDE